METSFMDGHCTIPVGQAIRLPTEQHSRNQPVGRTPWSAAGPLAGFSQVAEFSCQRHRGRPGGRLRTRGSALLGSQNSQAAKIILMTRRVFVPSLAAAQIARKGRLKQSACRWCYKQISLEDLAREGARLGLKGIDLINPDEWPVVKKYGLTPTMVPGAGTIPDGLNRKENHAKLEAQFRENIPRAAAAGVPNVITFSGNRRGQPDAEGLENCVIGLNRVKKLAEDEGVTICLELLNSKVNHKDYQCDHTAWGVEVVKRVGSPRVKLLYDITTCKSWREISSARFGKAFRGSATSTRAACRAAMNSMARRS